ncbi:hypothetical protein ACFL1E_02465 [Candidatus Omnitrophota bacterium]
MLGPVRKQRSRKRQSFLTGFTFVELLISMVLLATVTAGIISAFTAANRHINRSQRRLMAAYLANQIFQEIKEEVRQDFWAGGFFDCGVGGYPCDKFGMAPCVNPPWPGLPNISLECLVDKPYEVALGEDKIYSVSVTITWNED